MSKQQVIIQRESIGLGTLLTVLFVGLKLTDHIDWSWVWVLSPLWIPLAATVSILAVAGIVGLVIAMFTHPK